MEFDFAKNLRMASRLVTRFLDNRLSKNGCQLRYTELFLLNELNDNFNGVFYEKAKELGMDRTTISRNIFFLSKKGLITIESKPSCYDGRKYFNKVHFSKLGEECLKKGMKALKDANKELEGIIDNLKNIDKELSMISFKVDKILGRPK